MGIRTSRSRNYDPTIPPSVGYENTAIMPMSGSTTPRMRWPSTLDVLMKRVCLVLVCAVLVAPTASMAQVIHGRVVEAETQAPIVGAIVEIVAADTTVIATARSTRSGTFLLQLRRTGDFTLRARHASYTPMRSDAVRIQSGEVVEVEVRLASVVITLDPLVVVTRSTSGVDGFRARARQTGTFGKFITRAEIEARPGSTTTDLLRGVAGVHLVPVTSDFHAPRTNLITMRGGPGGCTPTIYIDGIVVYQYPGSGVDDLLSPQMLEGIEVYTSTDAPGAIPARSDCGVVAFWTRPFEHGQRFSWKRLLGGLGAVVVIIGLTR